MTDDVVIIGASSAGLFTAYELARHGVPVRVYDQAERLAPPARTLIVTSELNRVLGFVPEGSDNAPSRAVRIPLKRHVGETRAARSRPDYRAGRPHRPSG